MRMKQFILSLMAVALASMSASCTKDSCDEQQSEEADSATVEVSFYVYGWGKDIGAMTRASLSADGYDMTDLWVIDYKDGSLKQQLHQSSDDDDFATPKISLSTGSHHVYFVASRGVDGVLSTENETVVWSNPRDTFWEDVQVDVSAGSTKSVDVTLRRVVTELRIAIADELPTGFTKLQITPSVWYYGMNYVTGEPVESKSETREVPISSSLIGTTGKFSIGIYGLSSASEFLSNIDVVALNNSGATIGEAHVEDAPFRRNRVTKYSGNLFGSDFEIQLDDEWDEEYNGEW